MVDSPPFQLPRWSPGARIRCTKLAKIEDVLNLGINYIVKVGDNIDGDNDPMTNSTFTIRIIPVVAQIPG